MQVENIGTKVVLELFSYGFNSFISVSKILISISQYVYKPFFLNHNLFENHHLHLNFYFTLLKD